MQDLIPYGRFGDLTILVGDPASYSLLTRLLWERGIGVLRVHRPEDLPRVRTVGAPRVALVCTPDLAGTAGGWISQFRETLHRVPVLVELDEAGDVLATVDQEGGERDGWTEQLPWLIGQARTTRETDE